MQYIHIKNIDKYNPGYKDRQHIWAKVYWNIFINESYQELCEIDRHRLIGLIVFETYIQKPVALTNVNTTLLGWDIKKRPILLTIQMLHKFIEVRNENVTQNRVEENRVEENRVEENTETITKIATKTKFLDFVFLTLDEHKKLIDSFGQAITDDQLEALNTYIGKIGEKAAGKKYKSHYFVLREWIRREKKDGKSNKYQENQINLKELGQQLKRGCDECGKEFKIDRSSFMSQFERICPDCREKERAKEEAEEVAEKKSILEEKERKCSGCGKTFPIDHHIHSFLQEECPECQEKAEKERKGKEEINRIERGLSFSKIPAKYLSIKTNINIDKYLGTKGVYLYGPAGVGKTVIACFIGRKEVCNGKRVRFVSAPKLVMELQDSFRNDRGDDTAYAKLKELASMDILIIDDIGAEKMTDFVRQSFYYLINEREQRDKKTIYTSNYSLDQLMDGRVASRIAGMCDVVELKGKDRRII